MITVTTLVLEGVVGDSLPANFPHWAVKRFVISIRLRWFGYYTHTSGFTDFMRCIGSSPAVAPVVVAYQVAGANRGRWLLLIFFHIHSLSFPPAGSASR